MKLTDPELGVYLNMRLETSILSALVYDIEYSRKILPYLKEEYFQDRTERIVFEKIHQFTTKYNTNPTATALKVEIAALTGVSEEEHKKIAKLCLDVLNNTEKSDSKWLIDSTEKFCKDKALYNAIARSIVIQSDTTGKESKNSIPEILREALGVTFDTHIGHDYIENLEDRYAFYHKQESKIPFDIDLWNQITKNGWSNKTLNIIVAPTNGGKSIFLCHDAAAKLRFNKNVLYITCEMAEERIAERIDANMMNMDLDDMAFLSKEDYINKFKRATENIKGKLIVKEYPMCTASVIHFKHLLDELRIKKNFVPDIIYVDYLNICASARYKASSMVNSYTLVKAVAEELRGLAQELDVPVVTASQVNRGGMDNSEIELTNTSESMGTAFTADFIMAMITTDELTELGQVLFKQLKTRYGDKTKNTKFVVGLDRAKMKFYNLEQSAQCGVSKQAVNSGAVQAQEKVFSKFEGDADDDIPTVLPSQLPKEPVEAPWIETYNKQKALEKAKDTRDWT